METIEQIPNDEESAIDLLPCHVCGRTFVSASLQKHQKVCEKHAVRKRKPFDSMKQRVEGTDIVQQKAHLTEPTQEVVKKPKKSNWKEKHLELLKSIRTAKGIPSENSTSALRSKSSILADTKQCPSCDRQFGPKAYDRHVEWCKEKKYSQRIQNSPAHVLLAKERLEARTKYIPPLNKFRKTPIREKYSNHSPSPFKTGSTISLAAQPPIRRTAKVDSNLTKSRDKVDMETKSDVSVKKTVRHEEEDSARLYDCRNYSSPIVSTSPKPASVKSYSAEKIVQVEKNDNSFSRKKHLKSDFPAFLRNANATTENQEKWKGDWFNMNRELQSSDFTLKPEDLFAVDDVMYEEFKKYEETYLKGRKEKNSSKKNKPKLIEINYKILTSEEDKQTSHINSKISTDSAYGSLTTSTPEHRTTELDDPENSNSTKKNRLPKFCHECGNKYPVATAKFCVECGIKRLIL